MALWWKKYMDSEERDLEEDLKGRKAEFEQQMAEMKEMDKYERKKERYERLKNRPRKTKYMGGRKKRKTGQWIQKSASGDPAKQQWMGQMGGAQGSRHREYTPTPAVQVGKSGAPQFMNLQQMGYHSPENLGFHRPRAQDMRFSPIEQRSLRNMQFQNAAIQQQAMRARASQPMFQAQREQARMLNELLRDADPETRNQWLERLGGGR